MHYFEPAVALDDAQDLLRDTLHAANIHTLGDLWDADQTTRDLVDMVDYAADQLAQDQNDAVHFEANLSRVADRIGNLVESTTDPKTAAELSDIYDALMNASNIP